MSAADTVITQQVTAYLVLGLESECCLEFSLTAAFHPHDPYAVRFDFPVPQGPDDANLSWTFGRELLASGLTEPSGDGDVHVWPCGPDLAMVELRSDTGSALIALPVREVRAFLYRSYAEVPPGYESDYLELDRLLHDLMGRA